MRLAAEALAGDDPAAHLVDLVEHLGVAGVPVLRDAVEPQRLGRATAALVERGDEAVLGADLLELLLVHGFSFPGAVGRVAVPAPGGFGRRG